MNDYKSLSKKQLIDLKHSLQNEYNKFKSKNLNLDISRGRPSKEQLNLSNGLLLNKINFLTKDNIDVRNYGVLDGIDETKTLFSDLLKIPKNQIIIGGNSSLNMLYDCIVRLYIFGSLGKEPWKNFKKIKILCPSPGYDRHFAIFEQFGFELIPIPLNKNGPDMDKVEILVAKDELIKGIICVPLFSNPTGVCYSDDVVTRLAKMKTLAKDFKIFWDNAYAIHHIYKKVNILNIFDVSKKYNTQDRILYFFSTSKINFSGSGISILASSQKIINETKKFLNIQTIGYDKINQLKTFNFFKTPENILNHMEKHAYILKQKFDLVLNHLEKEFKNQNILSWEKPLGGYFISVNTLENCAKKIVSLAYKCGLTLTKAGATFPYCFDPYDKNIRIAPSSLDLKSLKQAIQIFSICVKIVSVESFLKNKN